MRRGGGTRRRPHVGNRCAVGNVGLLQCNRRRRLTHRALPTAPRHRVPSRSRYSAERNHIGTSSTCRRVGTSGHTVRSKPSACSAQCANHIGRSSTWPPAGGICVAPTWPPAGGICVAPTWPPAGGICVAPTWPLPTVAHGGHFASHIGTSSTCRRVGTSGHTVRSKPSACSAQCANDIGRSPTWPPVGGISVAPT